MADKFKDLLGNSGLDLSSLAQRYLTRNQTLENKMNTALPVWRDIRDYLGPRTARFKGEQVNQYTRQDQKIINTKPLFAVRALPAGLQSGVTSPMRPWFRLSLADTDLANFRPVKLWLSDVTEILLNIIAASNLYDRLQSNYNTLGLYGTGALGIMEDADTLVRGRDFPIGSFRIATDEAGRVIAFYRDVQFSAEGMVGMFKDRCPERARAAYDRGDYDQMFDVLHVIEPNRIYERGNRLAMRRKYASVYVDPGCRDEKGILSYSGTDFFPTLTPRWDILGENDWGTGCGEIALGDAKGVQLMERRKYQLIDKNTDPTMVADASLRGQRSGTLPGRTVYVSGLITGRDGYKPAYVPNPYLNETREEIMRLESHIDEAFFKPLFLQVSDMADQATPPTATQINMMREEKLMMLGPVLGRINTEQNDPLIDIVFDLAMKAGRLPPPPKEIMGMPLKVEYISILAQAQKAIGLGNIERCVNFIGGLAQITQDPSVFDKIDLFDTIDRYAEGSGVPPSMILPSDEANQKAQGRAQQQQMAQGMMAAQAGADVAKTMSETNMAGENALARAMQVVGG